MSPQALRLCSVLAGLACGVAGVFVLKAGQPELAGTMFVTSGALLSLPVQAKSMTIAPPPPAPPATVLPPAPPPAGGKP